MNKKNIIIAFFLLSVHYFFVIPTCAINMQSGEYRIQMGTVDSGGGKMTDPVDDTYTLSSSIGQSAAKEFQSNGYVVKAGFQYIYSRIPFSFYLSTIRVDLGTLLPNSPRTGDITMKVSFGGAGQYIGPILYRLLVVMEELTLAQSRTQNYGQVLLPMDLDIQ
ncbi:MAG: hypothetical protein NTZ55_04205 [Candidatus Roizmanbacteria bacterium]|nr:hypothetical protein [Candidatus Roizmanbacteria bacterium]